MLCALESSAHPQNRKPVEPAQASEHTKAKKQKRTTEDVLPLHSFDTLIAELGTLCKNQCRFPEDKTLPPIQKETEKSPPGKSLQPPRPGTSNR